jgi:hypothetical protein
MSILVYKIKIVLLNFKNISEKVLPSRNFTVFLTFLPFTYSDGVQRIFSEVQIQ